jgi:nucleotide-binding universal stress UspA family protein
MVTFKKILFPVDFSDASPKIAPRVLDMGEKFGAEIHLLFVARTLQHFVGLSVSETTIENFEGELIRGSEAKMEELVGAYFQEYPACKTKVVLGDASEEILKYVESQGIDLIIIGTHGRKGIERIFFGSVAEKVVKSSPVPVMVVSPSRSPKA